MVVGDRPPASLTSSGPDPAVTAPPWPAEPGGVCRTRRAEAAIIRSAAGCRERMAARASRIRSRAPAERTTSGGARRRRARQGDQIKPHRLHAPRRPIAAEHQTLHHRVEIVGENHDCPPRRIGPEQPARQPPAGERSSFIKGVRFLALAAAVTLRADLFVARQRAVGDEAEQLVAAQRRKAHRREGQLLGIAESEFTQRLADRQPPA